MSPTFNKSTTDDNKQSVRAATTANIALSGLLTVDTVVLAQGDRVLVKDQGTAADNGIYRADPGAWSRAADANGSNEISAGLTVVVAEGSANEDKAFVLTTDDPITTGVTALTFAPADTVYGGDTSNLVTLGTTQTITGAKELEGALAATDVLSTLVAGDTGPRLVVNADGGLEWHDGAGGGIQASIQQLGGNLISLVGGYRAALEILARNGAAEQVRMGAIGGLGAGLSFGIAEDTNLYRSAANELKTDDSFIVDVDLTVNGNTSLGSAATDLLGTYGVAPVAQQATPVTLGDVITVLQTVGLVA